jgi:D-glycero-D-manno-heptose 1,7-bisphosphate phosphatase
VKLCLLDRDGTLIEHVGNRSARCPSELRLKPGVVEGLTLLRKNGFDLAIVTNQPDIARGLVTVHDALRTNQVLAGGLRCAGIRVCGSYTCEHDDADGCDCRKPKPGLLLEAMRQENARPSKTVMIGDSDADEGAAKAAGVRFYRVGPERSFAEAACAILADEREKTNAVS